MSAESGVTEILFSDYDADRDEQEVESDESSCEGDTNISIEAGGARGSECRRPQLFGGSIFYPAEHDGTSRFLNRAQERHNRRRSALAPHMDNGQVAMAGFLRESKCFYSKYLYERTNAEDSDGKEQIRALHVVEDIDDGVRDGKKTVDFSYRTVFIGDVLALSDTPKLLLTSAPPFKVVHANGSARRMLAPWSEHILSHCTCLTAAVGVILKSRGIYGGTLSAVVNPVLPDHGVGSCSNTNSDIRVMYVSVEPKVLAAPVATQLVG